MKNLLLHTVKTTLFLLCLVSFLPWTAYAAQPLSLPELLQIAKAQNPQLEQIRQLHLAAQAAIPQATASSNPQIGLIQNPIPGSPFRLGASEGFSYTLTQPFQLFGKKALAGAIAKDQADTVGTQVTFTEQQLQSQVKGIFYQLLASLRQETVSQDNIQRLEQIKRITKIRYANNAAAYGDYLNAQVAQSSAQNDLFALQRQTDTLRQTLNTLIGRDPQQPLAVSGEIPGIQRDATTLDQLILLTLKNNPALKGSGYQMAAAEKGVTYARKAYLPDFQVIVTKISDHPPWGLSGNTFGMELDIVLPTWFLEKEKAGEDQARANLMAVQSSDQAMRQQVLLNVASAYNTWLQAVKQVQFLSDRQLPEANAAWRLMSQNYATNNGTAFSDLLLAQSNLKNTELALLQAESAAAQSWSSLEAAVGAPLTHE
ncbi:MAG: TolC family protein [Proteobacteria bacterium]|nr:TolC family protein [Pseudomonadota bacterium]HQR02499.1 TolC family protein [Rhodocyclaceae bacterium]